MIGLIERAAAAIVARVGLEARWLRDCRAAVEQLRAERARADALSAIGGTPNDLVDRALDRADRRRP